MFKVCCCCEKHLCLEKFHKLKNGKFGRNSKCKDCRKRIYKRVYEECKEKRLICKLCNKNKRKDFFYKNKRNKTGFMIYCKDCQNEKIINSMSKLDNSKRMIQNYLKKVLHYALDNYKVIFFILYFKYLYINFF